MDDFRVGSIPSYDPIVRQRTDDEAGRKKKRHSEEPEAEADVVSLSDETSEDEDSGSGYAPHGGH